MPDRPEPMEPEPFEAYFYRTLDEATQKALDEVRQMPVSFQNVESVRSKWTDRVAELHLEALRRRCPQIGAASADT